MYPVIHIGPAVIQSPILALIAALWLGAYVAERECKRRQLNAEDVWNVVGIAAVATVIAARLIYVMQNFSAYASDPLQIFSPTPGTLSLGFGAIFGLMAAYAFAHRHLAESDSTRAASMPMTMRDIQRHGIPPALFFDALAPGALIAMAVFAIGQLLGGDAYGTPSNLPWSVFLWGEWRHPVQLYDALAALIGFIVVWRVSRGRSTRAGFITLLAIAWYSASRVFIDAFRGETTILPGGYRASQVIALVVLLMDLWFLSHFMTKDERPTTDVIRQRY